MCQFVAHDVGDSRDRGCSARAQIERSERPLGVFTDVFHGIEAVFNVHIGFLLPPVAEDHERFGSLTKLLDKIGDGCTPQSGADDVRKADVIDSEPVGMGGLREDPFAGESARAVGTDRFQRGVILWRWTGSLTVDCRSRDEYQFGNTGLKNGVDEAVRHLSVIADLTPRAIIVDGLA